MERIKDQEPGGGENSAPDVDQLQYGNDIWAFTQLAEKCLVLLLAVNRHGDRHRYVLVSVAQSLGDGFFWKVGDVLADNGKDLFAQVTGIFTNAAHSHTNWKFMLSDY